MKRLVRCASSDWVEPGKFDKTYLGVAVGSYHNIVAVIVARDESVAEQYFRRGANLSSHWDSVYVGPFNESKYRNELNSTFSQSDQRRYTEDATARVAKTCGYPVPPQYEEVSHQKEAAKFWDAVYLKLTSTGGPLYVCYVDYDEDRRVNYWLNSYFVWPDARFVLQGSIEESDQYPRQEIGAIRVDVNSDTELPANIEEGMSLVISMLQERLAANNLPPIPTKIGASVMASNPGYKNMQVPYESDAGPVDEGPFYGGGSNSGFIANINDKIKFEHYDGVIDEGDVTGQFTDGSGDIEVLSDGQKYRITPSQFISVISSVTAAYNGDGYMYVSTHGIGPGTLPKDVILLESEELDGMKTRIWIDRPLTSKELSYYDIRSETGERVTSSTYDPDMHNGKGGFKFNIDDKRKELDSRIDWVMHHFDYDDRVNPECDSYKGASQAIDYANKFITEIQKGSTDSEVVRNAVKWTEMAEQIIRKCIQEGEDLGYSEDGFIDDNDGVADTFDGD